MRHLIVGFLTLALTVGAGWQSCAAITELLPATPHAHIAPHGFEHHECMHAHDRGLPHHDHSAAIPENSRTNSDKHVCLKCCGACMFTTVLPLGPEWTVVINASHISFIPANEQLRGHTVFVDPEIPKPVA